MSDLELLELAGYLVIGIVITVSAWIATLRARQRMGRVLGRRVTVTELTSITSWMKVLDAQRRDQVNKP